MKTLFKTIYLRASLAFAYVLMAAAVKMVTVGSHMMDLVLKIVDWVKREKDR